MCVVSMVYDHFGKRFDDYPFQPPWPVPTVTPMTPGHFPPPEDKSHEALRKMIEEFREAVAAARKVDVLTKQPDCVDPVKAKLEERVATLEKQLAAIKEALAK